MKKITTFIFFILMSSSINSLVFAQEVNQDWAGYSRYAEANSNITKPPLAVFMGNSITQCWVDAHPEFFTLNNYAGRGISGQTTYEMLARFQADVVELAPKYVVILAGTNDLAKNQGDISLDNILGNIKSMCQIAIYNDIEPIVCSVLPVYEYAWRKDLGVVADTVKELNDMLKEYALSEGLIYVDYHTALQDNRGGLPSKYSYDGVHLEKEGYLVIENIIKPILVP